MGDPDPAQKTPTLRSVPDKVWCKIKKVKELPEAKNHTWHGKKLSSRICNNEIVNFYTN